MHNLLLLESQFVCSLLPLYLYWSVLSGSIHTQSSGFIYQLHGQSRLRKERSWSNKEFPITGPGKASTNTDGDPKRQ